MNPRAAQTLTMILAGICGALLLLIVLCQFGFGQGYSWLQPDDAEDVATKEADLDRAQFKLSPWNDFAEVNARPLFNEDRKPTPAMPSDDAVAKDERPIPKLNVSLSGVIITRKVRMVMIKENGKAQTTTIKEGNALPGDLGAWNLAKVKPRGAVFKNTAGEDVEVELIATGNGQKPPLPANPNGQPPGPVVPGQQVAAAQPGSEQSAKNPEQTSAELQQRIEARRQQIRDQNERAKQGQPQPQPQHQPQ